MLFVKILVTLSVLPFLFLLTQINSFSDVSFTSANTAGLIGSVFILWQFVLGVRNVSGYFTKDYIALMNLHKFLGTYGLFFIFFHPLLETVAYTENLLFVFVPDFSTETAIYLSLGRVAFLLLLLAWFTSVFLRKNWISYRVWHNLHYLNYLLVPLIFLHAGKTGTFLSLWAPLKIYWLILMSSFIFVLIFRISRFLNIGSVRYRLKDKQTKASGITTYTLIPISRKITPSPGQFVYIRPGFFSESHPFSAMSYNAKSGELEFGIKTVGYFTKQLEVIKKGQTVYLDGPYGVFTSHGYNLDPKVIFAGGIGVTPFVELIRRFSNKDTYMFYSNRELSNALNRNEFIKELGANYKDVVSDQKIVNPPVISGRINEDIIRKNIRPDILKKAIFFVCGSPAFMTGVIASLKGLGIPNGKIHTEEFSF